MVTNKLAKNRKSKRAIDESNNVANKKPKLEPNNGMAYGRAGNNDRQMQDSIKNQKPAKQRSQQSQRFTKNVKVGRSTMIDDLSEQDMTSSDEEEGFDDGGEEDVVEGYDESENDIDNEDEEEEASKVSSSEDVDDEEEEDGNVESDEEEDADEVKEEEKLTKEEDASGTEDEEAKEEEVGSGSSDEEEDVKPSKKQIMNMRMAHLEEGRARTVFVGNVPVGIKRKTIKEIFSPFGKLEKVYQRTLLQKTEKLTKQVLAKDKQNELGGRLTSTNFFVRFSQETEAEKAVKQLQGTRLEGHTLRITLGNKHKCDHKRSIFIGNLPFSTTEEQARAQFRQFGPVSTVRLLHNKENGQNRGCGYVEFAQKESVAKALGMDGREFMGRKLRVAKVFKKKKVTTANPVAKTTGNAYNGRDRNSHLDDIPKRAEKFLILKRNGNSGAVDDGKTESQKREGGGKKKPGRRSIRSQKWRQKQQKDGGGGKRKSLIT